MSQHSFQANVVVSGSRTYVAIPFDPDEIWGKRARHDVTGTVNGRDFRGRIQSIQGVPALSLGPAWRRDNGVQVGDLVQVVLRPEGPQVSEMAADIAAAFAANPDARAVFEGLSTFCRKNYMRWIDSAKRPDTRARRITQMMGMLRAGKSDPTP